MKKFLWLSVFVLTVFAHQSCNSKKTESAVSVDSNAKVSDVKKLAVDADLTAFARYIAGVHDANNDSLEQSEFWKLHAAKTDLRWRLLMQNVGAPISTWVTEKNYLGSKAPKTL